MTFLRRLRRSSGIHGVAQILAVAPTRRSVRQTGRRSIELALELRVYLEGAPSVEPRTISHVARVPWDKLPLRGQRVPVVVSDGDFNGLRVAWDRVSSLSASMLEAGHAAERNDIAGAAAALGYSLGDNDPANPIGSTDPTKERET